MRLLILAAVLTFPIVAAHGKPAPGHSPRQLPGAFAECTDRAQVHQAKPDRKAKMSKLADLPPANLYLTVLRSIDRCPVPVMTGYGSVAGPRPATNP